MCALAAASTHQIFRKTEFLKLHAFRRMSFATSGISEDEIRIRSRVLLERRCLVKLPF